MEENKKNYGSSVLDYNTEENDNSSVFKEDIMTDEEVSKEREYLKSNDEGTVSEVISTDALSGIKESSVDKDYDKLIEILNEKDIKGKTITNSGKEMISDLLKSEGTDDEFKHISEFFETVENIDSIHDINITDIENGLGQRITEKIKSITNEDYEDVLRRFAIQLFNTYQSEVKYNDDMRQLSKLAKKVNEYSKMMSETENKEEEPGEITDIDKEFKNLIDMQTDIGEFMEKLKCLDDRNSRLKSDYTLDDYDIRTVESVKECLDNALSFKEVYDKLIFNKDKFKKLIKNDKVVNNSIENWIHSIRNDPYTLFTFPVNDFLSLSDSRVALIDFITNAMIMQKAVETMLKIPENITDIKEYMIDSNVITKKDIEIYNTKARAFIYMLSRTFKHKKLNDEKERRILSYTLDMISKLGSVDHRKRVIELADYIYDALY